MKWVTLTLAALVIASATVVARADSNSINLIGTLRDFKSAKQSGGHPDFENDYNGQYPLVVGMVKSTLGDDGTPVLNVTSDSAIPGQWRVHSLASFHQWFHNADGVNKAIPFGITLTDTNGDGIYRYERSIHNGQSFFPIDGQLWGNDGQDASGHWHNFHFTYAIHTKFTYTNPTNRAPMVFNFSGDDDVWVFINHKLAVDLGGVHAEQYANVNIDQLAQQLGLTPGKTYDFDFFYCERHTVQSNITIETTIQFLPALYD